MRSIAFAIAAVFAAAAFAGSPRYADIVLSDAKGGKPVSVFKPATPKIYVHASLVDVAAGSKVKSEWIAVKTQVAPPNYKIDAVELNVGKNMTSVDYSLSKPNKGWPVGDYRVDLFIDGRKTNDLKFTVK